VGFNSSLPQLAWDLFVVVVVIVAAYKKIVVKFTESPLIVVWSEYLPRIDMLA
jgi:hypothetical protein